ncbi:hypothetical protein BB560_002140 [Smittium megazygosporum]|uniref:Carbonyl reductase [NADPH] 1 n=1 Tax=Smittium megazygosporum TaxID=133381 RepID=A0A2T9YE70_9FUNG|nr:hypothetical protein BB560_006189 [Smittium megazygosporum]PVV03377.1 hypothetical protein BB560_002140 [Smittium megazygosporum]
MQLFIVTGANKGIGNQVLKDVALLTKEPTKILLTARDTARGETAVKNMMEEIKDKLPENVTIEFHQLDIQSKPSVDSFVAYLDKTYGKQCIDLLVNNAGYAVFGRPDPDGAIATTTINTNYFGTVYLTEALLEYMKPRSRIVFVSSGVAKYLNAAYEIQPAYFVKKYTSTEQMDKYLTDYIAAAQRGEIENGAPSPSYCVSKAALTTYVWLLSQRFKSDPRKILFLSCCPGWTKTDSAGDDAPLTLPEGAKTPVYLSTHSYDELYVNNGRYFHLCAMEDW